MAPATGGRFRRHRPVGDAGRGRFRGGRQSAGTQAAPFQTAREAGHHAVHVRRPIASGYIRSQAVPGARQRPSVAAGATPSGVVVPQPDGQPRGIAVRVPAAWPERALRSARSSRTWRAGPTTCASSTRCTAPTRGTGEPSWNGIPAATRSCGPAWGRGSPMDSGSENQNFPGYVTICQDLSQGGANNFGSGFLPAAYQGTRLGHGGLKPQEARIPFIGDGTARRDLQRLELDLIAEWIAVRQSAEGPTASWTRASHRSSSPFACKPRPPRCRTSRRSRRRPSGCTGSTTPPRPTSGLSACWRADSRNEASGSSNVTSAAGMLTAT